MNTAAAAPESSRKKITVRDMTYIALFAVIIAVCSWLSIPYTVPFTMQTFAVFAAVGVLGGKRGTLSVLVYLLMGIVGLPVFAGFTGGVGVLLGTTGGYIVGFLLSALVMWAMEATLGKKTWVLALSMVIGLIVCYFFGTVWFMTVYAQTNDPVGVMVALGWCVFPYIIPDLLKIGLALLLSRRLSRALKLS